MLVTNHVNMLGKVCTGTLLLPLNSTEILVYVSPKPKVILEECTGDKMWISFFSGTLVQTTFHSDEHFVSYASDTQK